MLDTEAQHSVERVKRLRCRGAVKAVVGAVGKALPSLAANAVVLRRCVVVARLRAGETVPRDLGSFAWRQRKRSNQRLERAGMRGWLSAASAGRQCALASLVGPWWPAAQAHR
jgi:hypothetical protein